MQMQSSQQLQQRLGSPNAFLGSLQQRYAAPLSGPGQYPYTGQPLPQPAPFNFNVQPQMPPPTNPWGSPFPGQFPGLQGNNSWTGGTHGR